MKTPIAVPTLATLLVVQLGMLALLAGCCNSKESAGESDDALQSFTVELSSGGGFSNMHAGHIIHDDGSVLFWQGLNGAHESMRTIGAVKRDRILALRKTVTAAALSGLSYHETGNMTTTLRVTDGEVVTVLTWAGTTADAEQVPAELQNLYRLIQETIAAAESGAAK